MKYMLFAAGLLLHCACSAQSNSRVIFFRMDAPLTEHTSPRAEWRVYADPLIFNGRAITKMKSATAFVMDSANVKGTYFLKARANKSAMNHRKLTIDPGPHSVTIIKISLSSSAPIVSYAEVVPLAAFRKCYENNEWLQKEFAGLGYNSIEELVAGYDINEWEVGAHELPFGEPRRAPANTLTDTLFYNEYFDLSPRRDAKYYKIVRYERERYYSVKEYYAADNKLKFDGHYANIDSELYEGNYTGYAASGRLESTGKYHNGDNTGVAEGYYDTLNSPISSRRTFDNDGNLAELTCYYLSGKLKRKETHRQMIIPPGVPGNASMKPIDKDSVIHGNCYFEDGRDKPFTPYETMPSTDYNMNAYLARSTHYPEVAREHDIEGRAVVRFVVNKDGSVSDARLRQHVSPEIDAEALRVVSGMPRWKPGIQNDEPVKVYFTIPIVFRLE